MVLAVDIFSITEKCKINRKFTNLIKINAKKDYLTHKVENLEYHWIDPPKQVLDLYMAMREEVKVLRVVVELLDLLSFQNLL